MGNVRSFRTTDTHTGSAHTHPEKRSWPWLVAAVFLCPCHIPILLAILGTGVLGGALARSQGILFVALAAAFGVAIWRALAKPKGTDSCPTCQRQS